MRCRRVTATLLFVLVALVALGAPVSAGQSAPANGGSAASVTGESATGLLLGVALALIGGGSALLVRHRRKT